MSILPFGQFYKKEMNIGQADDEKTILRRKKARDRWRDRYRADPEFREKCRAQTRENSKTWRQRHPDKVKEQTSKWFLENPDRAAFLYKRWREIPSNRISVLIRSRIVKAKRVGIPFDRAALKDLTVLPATHCGLCGVELDYSWGSGKLKNGPSIDRVDGKAGYVAGNLAILCNECNTRKGDGSAEQHRAIAEFIERYKK